MTMNPEADDTRVVASTTNNIVSSLTAIPTYDPFTAEAYYKDGGTWKRFYPYVNNGGTWTQDFFIYKNVSGVWTRSY